MSKSRVKPAGWAFGEILTSTQMNTLDAYFPDLVDGAAGGQYTPSAQLDLQGTGGGAGSALNLANFPTVDSQTVTRVQPMLIAQGDTGGTSEIPTDLYFSTGYWYWATAGGILWTPISNVPDKSTLTTVRVYAIGTSHAGLPATMPEFQVTYINNTGTAVNSGVATDSSTPVSAFNAWHATTLSGLSISINQATATAITPYVKLTGPSGAGFEANKYAVARIECDFTVTRLTPG